MIFFITNIILLPKPTPFLLVISSRLEDITKEETNVNDLLFRTIKNDEHAAPKDDGCWRVDQMSSLTKDSSFNDSPKKSVMKCYNLLLLPGEKKPVAPIPFPSPLTPVVFLGLPLFIKSRCGFSYLVT